MSVQAITWALEQTTGSATGKAILLCLANYADKHGACFPGQKTLADECEVSVRTVVEWMAKLEELGLLVRSRRFRENGSRTSDSIILCLPGTETTTSAKPSAENARGRKATAPSADDSVDQVQPVHPHNLQKNLSPQPPSGGLEFASLLKAWPTEHQGNRDNAEGTWNRLSDPDKAMALAHIATAIQAITRRGDRMPALVMYLRNRIYAQFEGAPEIDAEGYFVIKPGMPEWNEWLGWIRGKYGEKAVQQTVMRGYFLTKERWPAKVAA